ncbi:MAG: serine/threonine protein kinase [Candidatus Omnitrophica bacterium]|nr:serine/threonine protein kinase [Candidatus Omnitrophota bacterium]
MAQKDQTPHFHFLTPDVIIKLAEEELQAKVTNLCRPYKSYINRVYELQRVDCPGIVIKFYRPGRWSREALQDEHDFLCELADAEIPVIAPLQLKDGNTLGKYEDTFFAIFPKKGGRNCDEFTQEQWLELGRLIGRVHAVGALKMPRDRITLTPDKATRDHVNFIVKGNFIPKELSQKFADTAHLLIETISPFFKEKPLIRIHGDCYFANIIYRPDESFYLIDLDDMVIGTPIHDVWMLLPGYVRDSRYELNLFIEGYETFRNFDRGDLILVEPLRAMRYLHFTAWCAHQIADGGFSSLAPGWGTKAYWQTEIDDLAEQIEHIRKEALW